MIQMIKCMIKRDIDVLNSVRVHNKSNSLSSKCPKTDRTLIFTVKLVVPPGVDCVDDGLLAVQSRPMYTERTRPANTYHQRCPHFGIESRWIFPLMDKMRTYPT